jgi:hypothetical protein
LTVIIIALSAENAIGVIGCYTSNRRRREDYSSFFFPFSASFMALFTARSCALDSFSSL